MKKLGSILIYSGIVGFVVASIQSFTTYSGLDRGAVPAASFFFIIIGLCFYFPSLLEEEPGQLSTMRVCVLSIVMVFVVIYVKIGWNAGSFEEFTIDKTWVYILGIALGAKTMQKFGEPGSNDDSSTTTPPTTPPPTTTTPPPSAN
jgi:hypothetical protein